MMQELSIAEAGRLLRAGKTTSAALTETALARAAVVDPKVNAFITLTADRARADAARADAELAAGTDRGPLHGIPYALKDIYDTAGIRSTCHSKLRVDNVPAADSVVAEKLAAAGGVLLGKLGTHEFALGGPSFDLPFPPARNPWNPDHIPGGSSSGSGAAIAGGITRLAMGSDTGGSIRGPAAYCGTIGLKPTYGRVSRRGVFPLSTTLDHCGPLARSVEDAAIAPQIIAGHDPSDPASADVPVGNYLADLEKGVAGLRIGIPRAFFAEVPNASPEILAAIDRTADALRAAGAVVEDVTLPPFAKFSICGRVIMFGEAYAIHEADMRARPLDFGRLTFERFILGATITGADLFQAFRLRRELHDAVEAVLQSHDVLLTASSLLPAPSFADATKTPLSWGAIQTMSFNVTGHPALSVPTGLTSTGLPMGVQIAGRAFDEATVLRIGRAVETLSGWEKVALPAF
jgi:aspartyl-tRNA(Asn)/glutamyl-tRNA(Gln) amidotransferase subunit A